MSVAAQPVRVEGPGGSPGQGHMVSSDGQCYLLLPAHVAGALPRVTVMTEAPVRVGYAYVQRPFWPRAPARDDDPAADSRPWLDLAVGIVRGAATEVCEAPLASLRAPRRLAGRTGELMFVEASGRVRQVPMEITETSYLELEAKVLGSDLELPPGHSGAFLFLDGRPAGMAVRAWKQLDGAVFLHMEEIALNAGRWIGDQGAAFAAVPPPEPEPGGGLAVRLVEWSAPPVSPEFPAEAMLRPEGDFLTAPRGPLRLRFRVDGDRPVELSRAVVMSDPEAGHALPKDILVEVDSTPGRTRPRIFWDGEMAQDGLADSGARLGVSALWITVTITSAWTEGPIAIRQIRFE